MKKWWPSWLVRPLPSITIQNGYQPYGSGMLKGGGPKVRRRPFRPICHPDFPDCSLADRQIILEEVPDFEEGVDYTTREKELLAEKILLGDSKHWSEPPVWLPIDRLIERMRREIYTENGIPDPAIESGLYWRAHPSGRKLNSEGSRKSGAAFYR